MPLSAKPYAAKKFADIDGRRMAYIDAGAGAGHRLPARQPHLVLPVAQRHAPLRGPRPARRLRPDRHGRQRQALPLRPRPLHLRRAARTICSRCGTSSTSATRSCSCCTTGARRSASSGRAAIPSRVAGIVYMEAIVTPRDLGRLAGERAPRLPGLPLARRRGHDPGEEHVRRARPAGLDPAQARRGGDGRIPPPLRQPGEDRRPTLTWPRQIPIDGEPADVVAVVDDYSAWLATSPIPKLFINADPGSILVGRQREVCRTWPNQTELTVHGLHFLQEDSPDEIGRAVADFVRRVRGDNPSPRIAGRGSRVRGRSLSRRRRSSAAASIFLLCS